MAVFISTLNSLVYEGHNPKLRSIYKCGLYCGGRKPTNVRNTSSEVTSLWPHIAPAPSSPKINCRPFMQICTQQHSVYAIAGGRTIFHTPVLWLLPKQ